MTRWLTALTLCGFGGLLYGLVLTGQLGAYLNDSSPLLLLSSGLILLWMGLGHLRAKEQTSPPHQGWLWVLWPVSFLLILSPNRGAPQNQVLYIGWDEAGAQQLYKVVADGQPQPQQLTWLVNGQQVLDFEPAPDGSFIAYTVQNPDQSSDIWTIDPAGQRPYPLLDCLGAICRRPTWSPESTQLVYERRNVSNPNTPRLWWLDAVTGETQPVFTDRAILGYGAHLSPNGRWLGFLAPDAPEIRLYDRQTKQLTIIPSETGEMGAWHPTNDLFLYTDVQLLEHTAVTALFQANLTTGEQTQLTPPDTLVNDGAPIWSPNGRYLAFGRQPARVAAGKQIYLWSADENAPHQLTNHGDIHHGALRWSPQSTQIAFQYFDITRPDEEPSIWRIDIETSQLQRLTPAGFAPQWLTE